MTLPIELEFLKEHLEDPSDFYKRADWLLNPFEEPIWKYNFDFKKGHLEIDWNMRLEDGSYLIDTKNADLLDSLKYWLIASTTPHAGGRFNCITVQYAAFNRMLHLIDYLLINEGRLNLSRYGLAALSGDDIKAILTKIASSPSISVSLFDWPNRLIDFSRNLLKVTNVNEIENTLTEIDGICVVNSDDYDEAQAFGVDPTEIPYLRAALQVNGFIGYNRKLGYSPNSVLVSQEIYRNTLRVKLINKPALSLLSFSPSTEIYHREYASVDVTTGTGNSVSPVVYVAYVQAFYNLGTLHELGVKAPSIEDILSIKDFKVNLKKMGRFRTLPSQTVFDSVKNAIEFHFDHGREILNGFLRIALAAKKMNCRTTDLSNEDFIRALGPQLRALGVAELGVGGTCKPSVMHTEKGGLSKDEHFELLRANRRLVPLVHVYFGAVQLVAGALTARRVGELNDLEIGEALDNSGAWIVFLNRKSSRGLMGLRSTEARPIEPIGREMLKEVERFQKILNRIGFGEKVTSLFSSPSVLSESHRISASSFSFNKHLDEFCDYFETPLNSEGNRYYIRQHQLRRFFALLFFYSNSFGGLETLQWMLGHTDLRHAWHYITESMSGEILRGAKSQFVAESLHRNGAGSFKDLAHLLKQRYGTDDFTLLDTEELEGYVSELLEEGDIDIEPEFFTDAEGEKFKVIVKIHERERGAI
ncbi:integrase [Marinobacter maritimus]|uniref:integrase n=1 Tax=Marinobacter maritimus TaxID=277961 RepID=UPI0011A586AB|nr:integrase [Marinobacter maritimus]|tara:strand:+ start:1404 stop:3506 length:2103 start_codon:yes stop_codon:yes gene_type:complete